MSVLSDCADAVVTALNAQVFSPTFVAVRNWNDLAAELADDVLHVDVVGVNHTTYELLERGASNDGVVGYQPQIAIGVRKKFGTTAQSSDGTIENSEVDALVNLLEAIANFLTERTIGTASDFEWEETRFVTSIVHKWLRENNQYTGIIFVTYTHAKSR